MTYPSSSLIGIEPPCSYSVILKSFLLAMFNGNVCSVLLVANLLSKSLG